MSATLELIARDGAAALEELERRAMMLGLCPVRVAREPGSQRAVKRERIAPGCVALSIDPGTGPYRLVAAVCSANCDRAAVPTDLRDACNTVNDAEAESPLIEAVMQWSVDDLVASIEQHSIVEDFCNKLAQAYEETYSLFRAMRLLATADSPRSMLESLCRDFQATLPFDWLALQFGSSERVVPGLRGALITSGSLPMPERVMATLASARLRAISGDSWTRVLKPRDEALATAARGEVVIEPVTHDDVVIGALLAGGKHGADREIATPEVQFLDASADFLGTFHENLSRLHEQRAMTMATLRALIAAIDAKDRYTCGHSERVAAIAGALAQALGLPNDLAERVRLSGLVHDVGKIGVPESVLCKQGKLTEVEFAAIRRHPAIGCNILQGIVGFEDLLPGVLHHHERWDGKGYPHGLSGADIPQMARIIGVADAFDAMSSTRSYRPALPRERVFEEIRLGSGSQFDPEAAKAFFRIDLGEYDALLAQHAASGEWTDPIRRAA